MQYIHPLNSVRTGHYESLLPHAAQGLNTRTSQHNAWLQDQSYLHNIQSNFERPMLWLYPFLHLNTKIEFNNQVICFRIIFLIPFAVVLLVDHCTSSTNCTPLLRCTMRPRFQDFLKNHRYEQLGLVFFWRGGGLGGEGCFLRNTD